MEKEDIGIIMKACVILYNIILEDECDNDELAFDLDIVKGLP